MQPPAPRSSSSSPLPQSASRDLFLSHRWADKPQVRRLAGDIEAQSFGARSLMTWLDEAEIRPGQSVPHQIEYGLENSRFFGIVMTPAYFKSESGWTDAEWHAALFVDPDNRRGRILPLLLEDCPNIPYLLRHLNPIDLRGSRYNEGLQRLVAILRDEPLPRPVTHRGQLITPGGYIDRGTLTAERAALAASPDVFRESLYCNLLPIERMPPHVYAAPIASALFRTRADGSHARPTKETLRQEIYRIQREQGRERPFLPAFRLLEDRIVTFHDVEAEDSPLSAIVEAGGEVVDYPTDQLIQDEDSRHIVTSLLNMALSRHLHRAGLVIDEVQRDRYYFPPKEGGANVISWRPRKRSRASRTVAKPVLSDDGKTLFWRHLGAYIKLMYLASRFYIFIKPTWVLTHDGVKVMTGPDVGKHVIKWTGAERNLHVLFHVRFWTTILQHGPGPLTIHVGDQRMEIASVPAMIQLPYGIANDQRDLMQQLAEEAELLAEEEDYLADVVIATQIAAESSRQEDRYDYPGSVGGGADGDLGDEVGDEGETFEEGEFDEE